MTPVLNRSDILRLHMHPQTCSEFWRSRLERLGLSREDVVEHPASVPPVTVAELRPHGIEAFLPRPVLADPPYLITSETSGFSGRPVLTCFSESEFVDGFVTPFIMQARQAGFPLRGNWLWAGPSGPHIVGKALREILRQAGGTDAFAVDFDPRWFKSQARGSLSARRYFDHIIRQVDDIVSRQSIDVLYATPPVVAVLAETLADEKRLAIKGVHYAGMAMSNQQYADVQRAFPNAVHMSGYGNSLFGMFPETGWTEAGIEYAIRSDRLEVRVVQPLPDGGFRPCEVGEEGLIMVSRFDRTVLILNMLLEDVAVRTENGICNPHRPHRQLEGKLLY